jgi:hypothetical protein
LADLAICKLKECIHSPECYRFNAKVNKDGHQTYLADPKTDCEEKEYRLFKK